MGWLKSCRESFFFEDQVEGCAFYASSSLIPFEYIVALIVHKFLRVWLTFSFEIPDGMDRERHEINCKVEIEGQILYE